jgi:hypothetical protein
MIHFKIIVAQNAVSFYEVSLNIYLKLFLRFKPSSGLWRCVVLWQDTDVLEDLAASIFGVMTL